MKILFLHPNMPGQYKHLVKEFAKDKNNELVFITHPKPNLEIEGVKKIEFDEQREPTKHSHRYLILFEKGIYRAQEVWRVCNELKDQGFTPDVICAHPGWGDAMFLKEAYPETPILFFMEFYYDGYKKNQDFEGHVLSADEKARIRIRNSIHLHNFQVADWFITPTFYQRNVHPEFFYNKMSVIHDGIHNSININSKILILPL